MTETKNKETGEVVEEEVDFSDVNKGEYSSVMIFTSVAGVLFLVAATALSLTFTAHNWNMDVTSQDHVTNVHLNNRPIIGIVARDIKTAPGKSFIEGNYVSFLESAGARVVPIRTGQPKKYYEDMVNFTNGILLPGAGLSLETSNYSQSFRYIFEKAIQLNKEGDYFPIWGTCLGIQMMCYWAAGEDVRSYTNTKNISLPLDFTSEAATSRLLGNAPKHIKEYLQREPITQNNHKYAILVETFQSDVAWFYKSLTTNKDRDGREFVSTMEAKEFPFYATQWHPEKNNFVWDPVYDINHGDHAVKVSQYMANFFVGEARKSNHRFPDVMSESKNLIQNFVQRYFLDGTFRNFFYIDGYSKGHNFTKKALKFTPKTE